jgi:hypothetical protein
LEEPDRKELRPRELLFLPLAEALLTFFESIRPFTRMSDDSRASGTKNTDEKAPVTERPARAAAKKTRSQPVLLYQKEYWNSKRGTQRVSPIVFSVYKHRLIAKKRVKAIPKIGIMLVGQERA